MSILLDWNCPEKSDTKACYFEQRDEYETRILVVISKPVDGMFTWLRIHDPTIPMDNKKEMFKWALYSPEEDDDFKFILLAETYKKIETTLTTRGINYSSDIKTIFEATKKGLTEALILQTLRIRRLLAKAKHLTEIALRF